MVSFPGDQLVTWRKPDFIRSLPSWKEQQFALTGVDI